MVIDFDGKIAIITGGGSGIGRAICESFAESNATVVCVDRDSAGGEETARIIGLQGRRGVFLHADVTDPRSVQHVVDETVRLFGGIDVLVNNAGYEGVVRVLTDYPDEVFDRVMAVNVKGVFLGLKSVLTVMKRQRSGVVVNIGSTASHTGAVGVSAYTASKHAVLGLTRTAALEVAELGIRVNAVCPGGTQTRMLDSLLDARKGHSELALGTGTPNGRVATPREIAASVLYLASDHAAHIVGQYLVIDGGRLAM